MPALPLIAASAALSVLAGTAGCTTQTAAGLTPAPPLADFCLEAQRVVVRTAVTPVLVLHTNFDDFVKSKAAIEPLTIQQYIWYEADDQARPVMVSCKLKSADHLNDAFGKGTAAGNGRCQDMNRLTYARLQSARAPALVERVILDPAELVENPANPGMTGPDWLKPYPMTWRDDDGVLHVRSKGFRVDWTDPQFAAMPGRFRGVQYCHLIAPDYLARLVSGQATAGLLVGREVTPLAQAPTR